MDSAPTPFKGRVARVEIATRLLRRFVKPGHVAEIRERTVTAFNGIEYVVSIDGVLLDSQLFHGARRASYDGALRDRISQLVDSGWVEQSASPVAREGD